MLVERMRVGSSARIFLDPNGQTAESRTQGVVRLDGSPFARSWRVTLGEPQIYQEGVVAAQGGNVPDVAWNVNPALGIIEWGVQGADFRAEVDWGRGCSFVLSADHINVVVQALNLTANPVSPNPAFAIFSAAITGCESLSAPTNPPTRTVYSGILNAPDSTASIKIPAFAKRVKLQHVQVAGPPNTAEIAFWANGARTQLVGMDQFTGSGNRNIPDYAHPIALPPQAVILDIRNGPAAAVAASWMAIFELDLG